MVFVSEAKIVKLATVLRKRSRSRCFTSRLRYSIFQALSGNASQFLGIILLRSCLNIAEFKTFFSDFSGFFSKEQFVKSVFKCSGTFSHSLFQNVLNPFYSDNTLTFPICLLFIYQPMKLHNYWLIFRMVIFRTGNGA